MLRPIYVEKTIRAPLDELWRLTQTPGLHARWDLRFTDIEYLDRASADEPQRFLYATRLGLGLRIRGTGETTGEHEGGGARSSALRFGSDDPRSLIREGSGYWKYIPTDDGVRFLTLYDYRTRWGAAGRIADVVFRPLMGWATAWSFDRLRLWAERGIDPGLSALRGLVHAVCRVSMALVFLWHGLVPKLIVRHPEEVEPIVRAGMFGGMEEPAMLAAGVAEVIFGLVLLVLWNVRWLYLLAGGGVLGLGVGASVVMPELVGRPFTPVTFTLVLVALCGLGWVASKDMPSARRCLRRKPDGAGVGAGP